MRKFNIAWLTTNRSCNNHCEWCYAKKTLNSTSIMEIGKAKLAVDELERRNVKRIVLIGGEPTIYPFFFDLVSYIRSKGIEVGVPTNGRRFKELEFAKEAKKVDITNVDISIKAVDEQNYYKYTKAHGLNEMIEGYNNLKKIGVNVTTSFVITSNNQKEFDSLVEFLKKNQISDICFQFVKPVLSLETTEEIMRIDEMGKFTKYIYESMKNTKINYGIEISFPICLIEPQIFEKLVLEHRISNCCHVPKETGINFDENFRVIPCNHFAEFPFSNKPITWKSQDSLDYLLESKIVREFREKSRSYPTIKCQSCEKWNFCGGGCFTRWLTINPNDYIK